MSPDKTGASSSHPTLTDHINAAVEIAERLDRGEQDWADLTTLLAHLHVIQEDYCDAA